MSASNEPVHAQFSATESTPVDEAVNIDTPNTDEERHFGTFYTATGGAMKPRPRSAASVKERGVIKLPHTETAQQSVRYRPTALERQRNAVALKAERARREREQQVGAANGPVQHNLLAQVAAEERHAAYYKEITDQIEKEIQRELLLLETAKKDGSTDYNIEQRNESGKTANTDQKATQERLDAAVSAKEMYQVAAMEAERVLFDVAKERIDLVIQAIKSRTEHVRVARKTSVLNVESEKTAAKSKDCCDSLADLQQGSMCAGNDTANDKC